MGLAVARELLIRHPDSTLCVLEREDRLAAHQTSHSSGVIHAGIYYAPGSLKARLCVEGARLLYAYCDERGIEARRDGKLIVAADESELPGLDELERRGRENQVPGLRRIDADEIAEIEPHARGVAALHSPADRRRRLRPGRRLLRGRCREGRRQCGHRRRGPAARCPPGRTSRSSTSSAPRRPASSSAAPALGPTGWRSRPGRPPSRGSSLSGAATCACAPSGGTSCAPPSTPSRIPTSPSSAAT